MEWLKGEMLYEGKAKRIYTTQDPDYYICEFKDSLTAFNGVMKAEMSNKGEWNNAIASAIMGYLNSQGIPTHFVEKISASEQVVRSLKMVPLEAVVRNYVAGSLAKRIGLEEGTPLSRPVLEYHWKKDELNDPLMTESLILALEIATEEQLAAFRELSLKVNSLLTAFMDERGIMLVDAKFELGYFHETELMIGDEISPDTCRFWNKEDMAKLDKDRFRRKLGNIAEAYQEVLDRVSR